MCSDQTLIVTLNLIDFSLFLCYDTGVSGVDGWEGTVSEVGSWEGTVSKVGSWKSGITVVGWGGWEGSISVVDCWGSGVVDGLGLGVGVSGWGISVFHNWCSLDFNVFDDWCSEDLNLIWDWDSDWFLDINVVGVDGDLSWVMVNSVKEGGWDSDTWSEDLWFVDD